MNPDETPTTIIRNWLNQMALRPDDHSAFAGPLAGVLVIGGPPQPIPANWQVLVDHADNCVRLHDRQGRILALPWDKSPITIDGVASLAMRIALEFTRGLPHVMDVQDSLAELAVSDGSTHWTHGQGGILWLTQTGDLVFPASHPTRVAFLTNCHQGSHRHDLPSLLVRIETTDVEPWVKPIRNWTDLDAAVGRAKWQALQA